MLPVVTGRGAELMKEQDAEPTTFGSLCVLLASVTEVVTCGWLAE